MATAKIKTVIWIYGAENPTIHAVNTLNEAQRVIEGYKENVAWAGVYQKKELLAVYRLNPNGTKTFHTKQEGL